MVRIGGEIVSRRADAREIGELIGFLPDAAGIIIGDVRPGHLGNPIVERAQMGRMPLRARRRGASTVPFLVMRLQIGEHLVLRNRRRRIGEGFVYAPFENRIERTAFVTFAGRRYFGGGGWHMRNLGRLRRKASKAFAAPVPPLSHI
jgi:hypothetical protein